MNLKSLSHFCFPNILNNSVTKIVIKCKATNFSMSLIYLYVTADYLLAQYAQDFSNLVLLMTENLTKYVPQEPYLNAVMLEL